MAKRADISRRVTSATMKTVISDADAEEFLTGLAERNARVMVAAIEPVPDVIDLHAMAGALWEGLPPVKPQD
jgi:hypothetical protein